MSLRGLEAHRPGEGFAVPAWRRLYPAGALLAVGMAMPAVLPMEAVPVFRGLLRAIQVRDSGYLLVSAMWLVVTNTLRALPLFLGAFLAAEGLAISLESHPRPYRVAYLVPLMVIPGAYWTINRVYGLDYFFGVPALVAVVAVTVLHRFSRHTQGVFNKIFIFTLLLFGIQWLHVAPVLTGLGFGAGSVSHDIKLAAEVLQVSGVLDQAALGAACVFAAIALVMAKFMVDHGQHVALLEVNRRQEMALAQSRLEAVEARTTREVQTLVHDLKTPLAAIQGIVTSVATRVEDGALRRDLSSVDQAIDGMSAMISEILHAQARRTVSASHLLSYVSIQFPASPDRVAFRVPPDLPPVRVNLVRVARALANLIQNGLEANALTGRQPVTVRAGVRGEWLRIRIRDRGCGIDSTVLPRVGQPGVSTKGGSGLGLAFAREILEKEHHGSIRIFTKTGTGTLIAVSLPLAREAGAPDGCHPPPPAPAPASAAPPTASGRRVANLPRILAVDDDPGVLAALRAIATEAEWEMTALGDPREAMRCWERDPVDLAIVDYHMPQCDGLTLVRLMRRSHPTRPILVLTVDDDQRLASRFLDEGASDFVVKPIKAADLASRVWVHLKAQAVVTGPAPALFPLLDEKGIQLHTLQLVMRELQRSQEFVTSHALAARVGLALPTAYRYLAALERHGLLEVRMQYGPTGRPRKTFRLTHQALARHPLRL